MTLRLIWTCSLFLFYSALLPGQTRENQNTKIRGIDYGRITLRPTVYPYFGLTSNYIDASGNTVVTSNSRGMEGFLRFSRYRPGRNLSLGIDVGYSQQNQLLKHQTEPLLQFASLATGSLIISPHVNFTLGGINKKNHTNFILGVSNRYELDRSLRYNDLTGANPRSVLNNDLKYLQRNSLYWMIGVGNIKDRFSLSRSGNKPSELSIQLFVPLFNQADGIVADSSLFASNTLGNAFTGLKRRSIHLGVVYSEMLDFKRNDYKLSNKALELLSDNRKLRAIQPLFNGSQPYHTLEGKFTFMLTQQAGVEQVDSNTVTGEEVNLKPTLGWRAAYTMHFHLNRNRYFDDRANRISKDSGGRDPFLFGVFAGLGVAQQTYRFNSSQRYYDFLRTTLSAEGGITIGETRGVTGFIGGGVRFFENTQQIFGEPLPVEFLSVRPPYLFGGVQLFSKLVIRAETTPLEFLEGVRYELAQRIVLSVGVGF